MLMKFLYNFLPFQGFTNQITEISFNYNGSQVVATCKDKKLRIFDTHTGELAVVCLNFREHVILSDGTTQAWAHEWVLGLGGDTTAPQYYAASMPAKT